MGLDASKIFSDDEVQGWLDTAAVHLANAAIAAKLANDRMWQMAKMRQTAQGKAMLEQLFGGKIPEDFESRMENFANANIAATAEVILQRIAETLPNSILLARDIPMVGEIPEINALLRHETSDTRDRIIRMLQMDLITQFGTALTVAEIARMDPSETEKPTIHHVQFSTFRIQKALDLEIESPFD